MLRMIYLNLLTTLTFSAVYAQPQIPPEWLILPQHSVSSTDDALALLVNPAGLGVETQDGSFHFLAPYKRGGQFKDWGIVLGYRLAFSAETVNNDSDGVRRRYGAGVGFGGDGSYFGISYSWTTGVDRQNSWDIGFLRRPYRYLSIGMVARGINTPKLYGRNLPVGFDFGVGFRPLGFLPVPFSDFDQRFILTGDLFMRRFDDIPGEQVEQGYLEKFDMKFGVAMEVFSGINMTFDYLPTVGGNMSREAKIWAGISINFGMVEFGGRHSPDDGRGVAYLAFRDRDRALWHERQDETINPKGAE